MCRKRSDSDPTMLPLSALFIIALFLFSQEALAVPPLSTNGVLLSLPGYLTVYENLTLDRLKNSPYMPPSLNDSETGVSSKDVVISRNPLVSARLYLPKLTEEQKRQKIPILVYFHGGGFFYDSAFSALYHPYMNKFAAENQVVAVSVEYRLAPEHHLPAGYYDCWEALRWVASHSTNSSDAREQWLINYGDFSRVFIGGDSSGGNFVNYVTLRAGRERLPGGVKLLGAFYACPYFFGSKPVGNESVKGHTLSLNFITWTVLAYPNAPGGIDNALINPVAPRAPSLAGLGSSRIIVCVAGNDNLRDRGILYYNGVKNSGWKGKLELFEQEGETHIYHVMDPDSKNGQRMMRILGNFIWGVGTEPSATAESLDLRNYD